ncbi:hypothetical protein [Chitinophaga nivalis]|uniref:Uncharacterized protein n=1 Tax=Chitinophaga nivalis TaxID=2991709 RepID=A0ABT3IJS4_9BACT|nr:hypothetical protein [Chitinophaga nivalis]MCW3466310.1 hypothetical protein [Chitinophaga nivalis]MCW3483999.1 hypothetical protein [Chitinophaga nivalis]
MLMIYNGDHYTICVCVVVMQLDSSNDKNVFRCGTGAINDHTPLIGHRTSGFARVEARCCLE